VRVAAMALRRVKRCTEPARETRVSEINEQIHKAVIRAAKDLFILVSEKIIYVMLLCYFVLPNTEKKGWSLKPLRCYKTIQMVRSDGSRLLKILLQCRFLF
jgi:hypothetical protein